MPPIPEIENIPPASRFIDRGLTTEEWPFEHIGDAFDRVLKSTLAATVAYRAGRRE